MVTSENFKNIVVAFYSFCLMLGGGHIMDPEYVEAFYSTSETLLTFYTIKFLQSQCSVLQCNPKCALHSTAADMLLCLNNVECQLDAIR